MATAGTAPPGHKGVPESTAAVLKKFRKVTGRAKPSMRWFGLPLTERAANSVEVGKTGFLLNFVRVGGGRLRAFHKDQKEDGLTASAGGYFKHYMRKNFCRFAPCFPVDGKIAVMAEFEGVGICLRPACRTLPTDMKFSVSFVNFERNRPSLSCAVRRQIA